MSPANPSPIFTALTPENLLKHLKSSSPSSSSSSSSQSPTPRYPLSSYPASSNDLTDLDDEDIFSVGPASTAPSTAEPDEAIAAPRTVTDAYGQPVIVYGSLAQAVQYSLLRVETARREEAAARRMWDYHHSPQQQQQRDFSPDRSLDEHRRWGVSAGAGGGGLEVYPEEEVEFAADEEEAYFSMG